MSALRRLVKRVYIPLENFFIPTESLERSQQKWNDLSRKNAKYFVCTSLGENVSDEALRQSGEQDYLKLVKDDEILNARLGDFKESNVLEVGCGIGRVTEFLARDFKEVFGIDISGEMVTRAKARLHGKGDVYFIVNDGCHYPFADNAFDFVFSYLVFQHIAEEEAVRQNFREIERTLKPTGVAKIQLRGVPIRKYKWSYGVHFDLRSVRKLLDGFRLKVFKHEGEGQKNFWVWLAKGP